MRRNELKEYCYSFFNKIKDSLYSLFIWRDWHLKATLSRSVRGLSRKEVCFTLACKQTFTEEFFRSCKLLKDTVASTSEAFKKRLSSFKAALTGIQRALQDPELRKAKPVLINKIKTIRNCQLLKSSCNNGKRE